MVTVLTAAMLLYKQQALAYPQGQFFIEAAILVGYALLSYSRLKAGIKGNRIERIADTTVMVLLAVFTVFGNCYFIFFQTYIMVIELVLHIAAVCFTVLEVALGLIGLVIFNSLNQAAK